MSADLAVIGQDPRFGGGFFSFASAFWNAATELGRDPHLLYLSRAARRRGPHAEEHPPFRGTAFPSPVRELDGLSQLLAARQMAGAARSARSLWVVAASAPYGLAAARSGRPYACWLATGLESEWASRRPELPPSRRAALAVNAPLLRRFERDVVRGARLVFTISPSSRDELAVATGRDDVDWLPIPVDVERLRPAPDEQWLARLDAPTILFVGRGADPRKNVRLLLEALPLIRRQLPGATLRLVGEPPNGPLPAGATAVGPVRDLAAELRNASLFVLPSLQEGFGIVVAEAFACGVPAIVTPCGGPEALVRGSHGGRVLDGFGSQELAESVVSILEDRRRLTEMRHAARAYVEQEHAPARLRERLAAAFEELDG
jgi:glycosyltransferase involved in cell wall biosynthesis